jgi:hypothetical protein
MLVQGSFFEEAKGTSQSLVEICEAHCFHLIGVMFLIATEWNIEQYPRWNLLFSLINNMSFSTFSYVRPGNWHDCQCITNNIW